MLFVRQSVSEGLKAGAGNTPHNDLYGEAPSDRGNFFRPGIQKRIVQGYYRHA